MKGFVVTFLVVWSFLTVSAQDAAKIKELEQRIQTLEERLAKLEGPNKMVEIAKQHVDSERKTFAADDITKAELLYRRGAQIYSEDGSRKFLDSLVSMYPQLNRAGCAQLYRAQQDTGLEKERRLKDCVGRFRNCYYLDGAQVGPLATFHLASYYRQIGKEREARDLFERLQKESPEAIGHDGKLLVNRVEPAAPTAEASKMMKVARHHADLEEINFKADDIARAEKLYLKGGSRMLSKNDSKKLLDSVVSTYPQLNRAGCAQLYRAQQETGEEKERLLKDCIERFSTCYYFDGAQVGPLAMFQLAYYYRNTGREHDAKELFERLRKESPEAVGHDGELLVKKLE